MIKDMTGGKPVGLIVRFAMPMMLGAVFQQLYNMVDMFVVGNAVGSRALAAVGATSSATFFALTLVMGLQNGFTAATAQYFGAKDVHTVRRSFVSAIYISALCTVALALGGLFGAAPLMRLLNTPADILPEAALYLQICIGLSIGSIVYNGVAAVLRAVGDSRTPLIFLIVTSLLNIALDLLFVLVFGWGVAGVAVATVLSQGVSATACVVYLFKRFTIFRLTKADFMPHWPSMGLIAKIGLPIGLQSLLLSIGDMTITGVVNAFGTDVVAAHATGYRVMMFSMMFCMNFSQAFAVFASQNLGARQIERIKQGFRQTCVMVAALSMVMTALVFLNSDGLVRLFIANDDAHVEAVVQIARVNLRVSSSFYLFLGLIWLYNNTLRSMGDVVIPFVSGLLELILKVGLSIVLGRIAGTVGIWFAMPLGWVLGVIPSAIRFHTGGWQKLADRFTDQLTDHLTDHLTDRHPG